MAGVLFIVTIPTEQEEREQDFKENKAKFGHSSKEDISIKEADKFEYGTFKISSSDELLEKVFNNDYHECVGLLNLPQGASMECIMTELFRKFNIDNAVWQISKNTKYHQIIFFVESNTHHELILSILNEWGIGRWKDSSMSMIPCAIYNQASKDTKNEKKPQSMSERKQTAWNKFISSVHARRNVAQIVQRVKEEATLTFDFVTLILVAGMLAAFGLIDNDTTVVISSMLICPLMGPVIATIFGIVIKDYSLIRFGLVNEMIGILMATLIGFVFGLVVCTIDPKYAHVSGAALTSEMIRRCEFHSLMFGIFTALPTGAAAAIAVLGEKFAPIVGVAISVSLLPPAVNAGVLWSLAVLYKINENDESLYSEIVSTNYYSNHQSIELAVYGGISMLLTVANVICILLIGVLILKIKEVAPGKTRSQHRLWDHDIKVARNFNKISNIDRMSRQLSDEISELRDSEERVKSLYQQSYKHTWSPKRSEFPTYQRNAATIRDLESISLCMEYPIVNQFDVPLYCQKNDFINHQRILPYANKIPTTHHHHQLPITKTRVTSILADLQTLRKKRLEKIPEGPIEPISTENDNESDTQQLDHSSDSSNSTDSNSSHVPIVADNSK